MQKKVYLVLFLVLALLLANWAVLPTRVAIAQTGPGQDSMSCRELADTLPESFAETAKLRNRIREICNFNVRVENVNANPGEFDRLFVESAIAANMLEIQSLEFALTQVTNEEWRAVMTIMLHMHTADLEMALRVAEKIGADTTPDLTRARVFPGTPLHDLGARRVDLVAMFLDPLMLGAGVTPGTPTALPTDMSTATGVSTDVITETATALPTDGLTETATVGLVGPQAAATYEDTDAQWVFDSSWQSYSDPNASSGTVHYTTTAGATAELAFNGTQFMLTYTGYPNRGNIGVYVDNALVTMINAFSASPQWQQTYTSPVFPAGDHTLRLVHAGAGTHIDVDAVQILDDVTQTATATTAPTDMPTETATDAPTQTATALPTGTSTETATTAPTDAATETGTALPTDAVTTTATAMPTDGVTGTATVTTVPTMPPTVDDFNEFSMNIIQDQHVMLLETALAAERLVSNDELRAFAKHTADMAELHLLLIKDLKYRVAYDLMLPPPRFEEEYQSPRRLDPR